MNALATSFKDICKRWPRFSADLYEFNFRPASYLHETRRSRLLPELPVRVWQSVRVQDQLSARLMAITGLADQPCFELPHPDWALALLPTIRVERLARHVGALAVGGHVRTSVSRDQVLGWKNKLGDDAYRFAMTSASLLAIGKLPALDTSAPLTLGSTMLAAHAAQMPAGMRERFLLKLPASIDRDTEVGIEPGMARRLVQTAFNLIEGEWCSYCAPIRN